MNQPIFDGVVWSLQVPVFPSGISSPPRSKLDLPVLYGTGKSSFDRGGDEMPLGKTGTCNDHTTPSKIGWFISYTDDAHPKIALAVLLRGNTRSVKGSTAAVVAGRIYRKLREQNYFAYPGPAVAINTGK